MDNDACGNVLHDMNMNVDHARYKCECGLRCKPECGPRPRRESECEPKPEFGPSRESECGPRCVCLNVDKDLCQIVFLYGSLS